VLPSNYDVIVVPKTSTYRITAYPYVCDMAATGSLQVKVQRGASTVFSQTYKPRSSPSSLGCGVMAVTCIWDGFTAADKITMNLSQSTNATTMTPPSYPSSITDDAVENTFAKLTVEIIA